ncbi:MAG: hypothetical protein LBG57_06280 [Treponema sp.]|nr:hypothetical protein [Treponema sp.]
MRIVERTFRLFPVLFFLIGPLFFFACADQEKIVFHPEPNPLPEQIETAELGEIVESRNGPADAALPEWLNRFLAGGIRQVEAQDVYWNQYIFIGRNRGVNLNALQQWADRFTVAQDFPRLAAVRIENRLLAAATLYPDDEYGEFFEAMIKSASDAEYPEALKEDSFWVKWRTRGGPAADLSGEGEVENTVEEDIYEFFVLISIDKIALQNRIRALMADIQTAVPPTRDQAASINRIRQNFFEVF